MRAALSCRSGHPSLSDDKLILKNGLIYQSIEFSTRMCRQISDESR